MIRTSAALLAAVLIAGCGTRVDEREMNYLASALTKVSASVDATVRYGDLPTGQSSDQVLAASTKHDSNLLKPFSDRRVLVQVVGKDSAVLICDLKTGNALLEDAGCTAKMDSHRWTSPLTGQCEFTLDVATLCSR